jgi:hypothetical protein
VVFQSSLHLDTLDQLVQEIKKRNDAYQGQRHNGKTSLSTVGIEIVSRGTVQSLPPHQEIDVAVFFSTSSSCVITAIFEEGKYIVDASKIEAMLFDIDDLVSVTSDDEVIPLCGFPLMTLPPVGLYSNAAAAGLSTMVVLDKALLEKCQSNNLLLLGNAGYPLWKTLLSIDFVLLQKGVRVVDFLVGDADNDVFSVTKNISSTTASLEEPLLSRPYFPISGPPRHLSELVASQQDISNPLKTLVVNVVGQVGAIKRATKKSLICSFAPPRKIKDTATKHKKRKICDIDGDIAGTDDRLNPLPWKCAFDDHPMTVELIFGKVFLQQFGPSKQGAAIIQSITVGQMLHIEARTNYGERHSLQKWIDHRSLDLIVTNCQILCNDDSHIESDIRENNQLPPGGSRTTPLSPNLSLDNLFVDDYVPINVVDDHESVERFAKDVNDQLQTLDKNGTAFIGIDCEWQPSEFMEDMNQPQPVLMLQISFHNLRRIHLLDLQQCISKPLQLTGAPIDGIEATLNACLCLLLGSPVLIKVGYQLSTDMKRLAASYPHMPCFHNVHAALEVASLIRKTLLITKQKKSRYIIMSLASMTLHYLGLTVSKECQLSDWSLRPLTQQQIKYAALDAAVSPVLVDKALGSIGAYITTASKKDPEDRNEEVDSTIPASPTIEGLENSKQLSKEIISWNFVPLKATKDKERIEILKAQHMVGPIWIATSSWVTGSHPPQLDDDSLSS